MSALTDTIPEAERAVIGSIVLDPRCIRSATKHITPDDFADPRLGQMFMLVVGMVGSGLHVDTTTVTDEVVRRAAADKGKGKTLWPTRADLVALWPWGQPTSVEHYARIIRDESVRRQVAKESMRMYQLAQSGTEAAILPGQAIAAFKAISEDRRGDGLPVKTLGEILDGPDDYDWVIPGLLERGDRVIVTGGEGAGKSTLVRQLAILAAAGLHPFTGRTAAPVRVLVVDAENSERQWRRKARGITVQARLKGQIDPADALHVANVSRMDITTDRDLGAVHDLLDEYDPQLLLIGPLYRLVPRAITNDDDAAPLLAALDSLRDRGPALVMEAHAGHAQVAGGGRDLRPRGSSALMGWPEFGFGIQRSGDAPDMAHLVRWRGDRDERDWPNDIFMGGDFPWSVAPATTTTQRWTA